MASSTNHDGRGSPIDRERWEPRGQDGPYDPRKAAILTDPDRDESLGHLGREQIMARLTLKRIVVQYTDGPKDAWERMPNIMAFLDEANAESASLRGVGRRQVVEVLAHDDPKTPSPEYVVPVKEQDQGQAEGGSRGL